MIIQIKIGKEHFYFIVILVGVLFVVGVSAFNTNNPAQFGHSGGEIFNISSSKVLPGTFGADVGADANSLYIFLGHVNVTKDLVFPITSGGVVTGIYWGRGGFSDSPYIDYGSSIGLRIGTGTGSNEPITIQNDLVASKNITLGGVSKGSWPEGIPSGFCVFSDMKTSCPTGWTRRTQFDGRTIQGSSINGSIGGSTTHIHQFNVPGYWMTYGRNEVIIGASGTWVTTSASSWPPYRTAIICCKN